MAAFGQQHSTTELPAPAQALEVGLGGSGRLRAGVGDSSDLEVFARDPPLTSITRIGASIKPTTARKIARGRFVGKLMENTGSGANRRRLTATLKRPRNHLRN
jgi:hypothetical protein